MMLITWLGDSKHRLLLMLGLTCSFFLAEMVVGYLTNSNALIADSFHMLSDVIALIIAYVAIQVSPKKWSKNTFGWARAEVLGAFVNAVMLLTLCFTIVIESIKRLIEPEPVENPRLLLFVGVAGLCVNLIGLCLFHQHGHGHSHDHGGQKSTKTTGKNLNIHGVFLHVLADALGSIIVIISALVIQYSVGGFAIYVDPVLSLVLVALIATTSIRLCIDSAMVLLQTVPTHIEVDNLRRKLLQEIDGVLAVHEFHIWRLVGNRIIASAHVRCRNLDEYMRIAELIKTFFHRQGIHSTTIQPEISSEEEKEKCAFSCPEDQPGTSSDCMENVCCRPEEAKASETSIIRRNKESLQPMEIKVDNAT